MTALAAGPLPSRTVGPLGPVEVARYAGASGDFNPLHLDAAAARAAGYDGIFVMGLLPASILASYLSDHVGIDPIRTFAVRYRGQVWLGESVVCEGSLEEGDDGVVTASLTCSTERSGVVLTGSAQIAPPAASA
jgi:acyl dehydratase